MVMLPPGGPEQGRRYEIRNPVFPYGPDPGYEEGFLDLAPGTPAWSQVTPWIYGAAVQGSKVPRTCVTYLGSTYVAIADDPTGTIAPGTDPDVWVCVARGGFVTGNAAQMEALDPVQNDGVLFLRNDMGTGAQRAWWAAIGGAWVQTTAVY